MKTAEPIIALSALAILMLAWIAGIRRYEADLTPFLAQALPEAKVFEPLSNGIHAGFDAVGDAGNRAGYVAIGSGKGYGGPMRVAVGVDEGGRIINTAVVDHKETSAYFQRVMGKRIPSSLRGKSFTDSFLPGVDVDAVSGATCTLSAMTGSVRQAARIVARDALGLPVPPGEKPSFKFGYLELVLILLFAIGFAEYWIRVGFKNKWFRWITLLTGIVVLGFIHDIALTVVNINAFLLGYWPDWHSHLSWYIIIIGVLFGVLLLGKSPYCRRFCPFGAAQECLAAVGGAKKRLPPRMHEGLRRLQRALALFAIVIALYLRNPGLTSYEPFGTLFDFTGSRSQFVLLGIVLIASLFLMRPWCAYLCPMRAVTDYIQWFREWVKSHFMKKTSN